MGKAVKDKLNKFTNSKYVDINSILELTEPVLQEAGLIIVDEVKEFVLSTKLIDPKTGDFLESVCPLIMVKQDPQSFMSALSYMRRANRVSLLGIAQTDDDGSVGSGQAMVKPAQIRKITKLALDTNTDMAKFLAHYRVQMVKDMYEGNAMDAIKTLELKLEKMGGQDGK